MKRALSTKEKLFLAAVDRFSQKGYRACTMQDVADDLSIKAASIYKHFSAKEQILDEIFEYYRVHFNKHRLPVRTVLAMADNASQNVLASVLVHNFGDKNEYGIMMKIARIIMDLRFENARAGVLFRKLHLEEPTQYCNTVFAMLIASGRFKPFNYEDLTYQMIAFAHMLTTMSFMDRTPREEVREKYRNGLNFLVEGFIKDSASVH